MNWILGKRLDLADRRNFNGKLVAMTRQRISVLIENEDGRVCEIPDSNITAIEFAREA